MKSDWHFHIILLEALQGMGSNIKFLFPRISSRGYKIGPGHRYRVVFSKVPALMISYDMYFIMMWKNYPSNTEHSQFMTNLHVGQVFSCWSNVSRLVDYVGQLTSLWQWVTLTLTKIWLTYDQHMTMALVKSSLKSTPSNDHDVTNIWPRFDQVFLV